MNEMKWQSRREIPIRMLTLERRVITSLLMMTLASTRCTLHPAAHREHTATGELRLWQPAVRIMFPAQSVSVKLSRRHGITLRVCVCVRERVRVQRNWANVCPLAKLLSRNVYFGRGRLYDHGHTATGVLAKSWTSNRELTLA